MAQPAQTYDTYDITGQREDLSNIIYDVSPTMTPFMSNIGRGKATHTLHEWQTDTNPINYILNGFNTETDK